MQRRFITLIMAATAFAGCRATGNAMHSQASAPTMLPATLDLTGPSPSINHRPFHFWMHRSATDPKPVLATNRTTRDLRYVSNNEGLSTEVSPAAIHCMAEVISAIDQYDLQTSAEWNRFRAAYPHRFLEILPEIHDFHTYRSTDATADAFVTAAITPLSGPALWAGQGASGSGFRVRGYLKWRGILLADGTTCLISTGDDVRALLSNAMNCEAGDAKACTLTVEHGE